MNKPDPQAAEALLAGDPDFPVFVEMRFTPYACVPCVLFKTPETGLLIVVSPVPALATDPESPLAASYAFVVDVPDAWQFTAASNDYAVRVLNTILQMSELGSLAEEAPEGELASITMPVRIRLEEEDGVYLGNFVCELPKPLMEDAKRVFLKQALAIKLIELLHGQKASPDQACH